MYISLKYGRGQIPLSLPSHSILLGYKEPDDEIKKTDFQNDIQRYLPQNNYRYKDIAIVVSDKTRLCGYPQFLPWLVDVLLQHGAQKENICFYIAYGTHPKQTEAESLNSYGSIYQEYKFVHHNCDDFNIFKNCGNTHFGTPITIRNDILKSTLLITFGAISHHYFAAYGGGRKLLFPGLASRKAIYHNHGLFLDKKLQSLAIGCQPGNLDNNPIAEDLKEIDSFMPPKVSIHAIMNASGIACKLIIGKSYNDFVSACKVHDSYYRHNSADQYSMVVASSGGYPKDINFIQTHKSIHHAAAFVKDGGTLLVLSECIDGIGSDYFMKYMVAGSFEAAYAILDNNYEGNGGTALSMMIKTKRIRICMLTSLDEDTCKQIGVIKLNKEEVQRILLEEGGSIAVIQNANILVK
jgi:lactate racemase